MHRILDPRRLGLLLLAPPAALVTSACASARPRWVEHVPPGHAHEYVVGVGNDADRAVARQEAIASALARAVESDEVRLAVSRTDTLVVEEQLGHGREGSRTRRYRGTLTVDATAAPVIARDLRVVDEHWERSPRGADVWVLMRRPRLDGGAHDPTPLGLALRSAVLPGWGQFAKQQPRRGALVLGSVVVAVPTAIVLGALRSDAALRASRAQTVAARTWWRDRANALGSARSGAVAVAATAYAFGVADAAMQRPHEFYASVSREWWAVGARMPFGRR